MKLRIFVLAALSIALLSPALAQGPRGRFGNRGPNHLSRLQEVLDLTDAQVASFESLVARHRPEQMALFEQMREARQTLRALIDEGNDPAAIGNATLRIRSLEEELRASREQLTNDFKNLLTTDQREKFEDLEELRGGRLLRPIGPGRGGPEGRGSPRSGDRARGGSLGQ